ncbi:hypothetical protein FIBSPDRAFT_924178 [Athelia psychrophila]|uniref:C2H2-type domain-containing protein n=1 Tax=Athelia psychrophila TaxID=1759441 RepID=A0A166WFL3_9AGAM|nr:hypothetical protein FIBSPDRAFT_924178 [Fibularhizoctonia sp. CBS 109695]
MDDMSLQGQQSPTHDVPSSPTSGSAFDGREMTSLPHPSQRPSAHRPSLSGDGLLLPPSPTAMRRSRSRGSISSRGHRHTLSDAESMAGHSLNRTLVSPTGSHHSSQGSGGSDQYLGGDLHGPGLIRARSAPGPGAQRTRRRAGTPYEQPEAHSNIIGAVPLDIPAYNVASDSATPDCTDGSSPSSLNERGVAMPAMLTAAEKMHKNPAKYQCPQCHASFTAKNSCKRHIASHLGEKRFTCSKLGCGQLFSDDGDRKRHEMTSKKHATTYTLEAIFPCPGIEPLPRHGFSCDEIIGKINRTTAQLPQA